MPLLPLLPGPSLRHRIVAAAIPRLMPRSEIRDIEKFRTALIRRNEGRATVPPAAIRRRWRVTSRDIGFPAWELAPRSGSHRRTVVHLHGGSFTSPAVPQQWRWAARFADHLDARLVFPAYPLAPQHSWRDSHEPLVELITELLAEGPVLLSGDSAGGGLALALAQSLRDRGGPQPEKLVLLAPWVDLTGSAPGFAEAAARDPWLSYDNHDAYAMFWAGDPDDLARPEVSPGLGDLTGLPPALVFCGTHDMLYAGCVELVRRAGEAGWPVQLEVGEGLLHVYPILPIGEARPAMRRAVRFVTG
ncbi:alpha/beta hydrolase fold domain-containing protein [Nocardioides limicola]|uniref:alpha/beta hydrolase fold domain-containing protein n=1 Tax=Nocardioides limicola TaxID=2803368 RepID=UPI00193C4667|nr:alpha/beta hydrolase [Nocardioides sp. DJM-14]